MGEHATHPIARLPGRLVLLLLLTGDGPAASSRLGSQPGSRTLERVQLRFLGQSGATIVVHIATVLPVRAGVSSAGTREART